MYKRQPFARLINNVEGGVVDLLRYAYASPANREPVSDSSKGYLRWPAGGLLVARVDGFQSAVILPPHVRHLSDIRISPEVAKTPQTIDRVLDLIRLSALWAGASLTGDPFAQYDRRAALRAMTMRIITILAGGRWAQLEEHGVHDDEYSFLQLQDGVGDDTYQRGLAAAIQQRIVGWLALEPAKRAEEFASVLAIYRHRTHVQPAEHRFAEFLLRLASDPSSLALSLIHI